MHISEASKVKIIGLHERGLGVKNIRKYLVRQNINHSLSGIAYVVKKWETTQQIGRKKGSGTPMSETRKNIKQQVKCLLHPAVSKGMSLRATARSIGNGISYSTVRRIAHHDLKMKVFKMKSVHHLEQGDMNK